MSDTPITDAESMGSVKDTRWITLFVKSKGYVRVCPTECAEHLERHLADVTAQRDALAEFARNVAATSSSSRLRREAKAALAAVNLEKQKVQFRK